MPKTLQDLLADCGSDTSRYTESDLAEFRGAVHDWSAKATFIINRADTNRRDLTASEDRDLKHAMAQVRSIKHGLASALMQSTDTGLSLTPLAPHTPTYCAAETTGTSPTLTSGSS